MFQLPDKISVYALILLLGSLIPKIANEKEASTTDFPYLMYVKEKNKNLCVGTLISTQFLVTSAECVKNYFGPKGKNLQVFASTNNAAVNVIDIELYPNFSKEKNDVALIEVRIPNNLRVKPVEISETDTLEPGTKVTLAGWNNKLQILKITVYFREECDAIYKNKMADDQFCAGSLNSKKVQFFQSGSPLLLNNRLLGILNGGNISEKPAIFTYIVAHRRWIEKIEKGEDARKVDTYSQFENDLLILFIGFMILNVFCGCCITICLLIQKSSKNS